MIVLGFHGGITVNQHEPSVSLAVDGKIVAICEEERYTRIKSCYGRLPLYSIKALLKQTGYRFEDIDLIVSAGKTHPEYKDHLKRYIEHTFGTCPEIMLVHHQEAHAATAFYASPFKDALCLGLDAMGDSEAGVLCYFDREKGMKHFEWVPGDNSLGLFYTLMTYYLGFIDGDEYKVMGLSPYGRPGEVDLDPILKITDQGWELGREFLASNPAPRSPFEPLCHSKVSDLLKTSRRVSGTEFSQFYKNVARSTQDKTEQAILNLLKKLKAKMPEVPRLCYAGGVSLNCTVNKKIKQSGLFEEIFVPPMASDRGLSTGCAYLGALHLGDRPQPIDSPYLGSEYSNDEIKKELIANGVEFKEVSDPSDVGAKIISENKTMGWFQGRSESGARALGNRSILANPQHEDMKNIVNMKIKYREEFRPFAPSAIEERASEYFHSEGQSIPYMNFTVDVKKDYHQKLSAITHVDGTARLLTKN